LINAIDDNKTEFNSPFIPFISKKLRYLIEIPEPNTEKENILKQQIEDIKKELDQTKDELSHELRQTKDELKQQTKDELRQTKDELVKEIQELLKKFTINSNDSNGIQT
jgi:gas vesicle protein